MVLAVHQKQSKRRVTLHLNLAVRKVSNVRRQLHELVDEVLNYHEKEVRALVRIEFKVTAVDTHRLKMAIE